MMPLLALTLACVTPWSVPPAGPLPSGAEASSGVPAAQTVEPVSFAPLEQRINVLIVDAKESDRRDRLIEARDLMHGMRGKDPAAQKRVYEYLERLLAIEERAQEQPIPTLERPVPMEEEEVLTPTPAPAAVPPAVAAPAPVDPAAVLAPARAALAAGKYLDAVTTLEGVDTPDAKALRKEAIDGWARDERERAGHDFLSARSQPDGPERITALQTVRARLDAINTRFPDNAYATQIRENIARVDADLAAAGATP